MKNMLFSLFQRILFIHEYIPYTDLVKVFVRNLKYFSVIYSMFIMHTSGYSENYN